jgi:LPS-assembly lipoprotein
MPIVMKRGKWLRWLIMPLLATWLPGCGFHLRGEVALAPVLEVTHIRSRQPYAGMPAALRNELLAAGARLADRPEDATGIINILGGRSLRRVLSVGSGGKASEYELYEEVRFSLEDSEGALVLEPQTIRTIRDLVFDEKELLGKVSEAEDIKRQMQRNLARQIMTRINIGTRQP